MMTKKRFIISLGGSLVVPQVLDTAFIKKFKVFIDAYVRRGYKFIIVVGGGSTARTYQNAARKVTKLTRDDLDWLGIHATRINAHYLRTLFKRNAYSHVVTNPTKREGESHGVIIASGWKPGWSTDYVAVRLAKTYGVDIVLNLSTIDYVHTHDPRKHTKAKKIVSTTWDSFQRIVGRKWIPGANLPFDPVASKLAKKLGLTVVVINGRRLREIKNYFEGRSFRGTVIH